MLLNENVLIIAHTHTHNYDLCHLINRHCRTHKVLDEMLLADKQRRIWL